MTHVDEIGKTNAGGVMPGMVGFCMTFEEDCRAYAVLKTVWRYGPVCSCAAVLFGMFMA